MQRFLSRSVRLRQRNAFQVLYKTEGKRLGRGPDAFVCSALRFFG